MATDLGPYIDVKSSRRGRLFGFPEHAPRGVAAATDGFRLTYLASLDGLRGLACLLVVFLHVLRPTGLLSGGFVGVDIFFVLSGFLITTLLLQEWDRTGAIDLMRFFHRRALRLLPAFIAMLAGCWIYSSFLFSAEQFQFVGPVAFFNLIGQGNRPDIVGGALPAVFLHTWSLAVEGKFYLLWPLVLCALLTQKIDRRWLVFFVAMSILAFAALRARLHYNQVPWLPLYMGLDTRADELLCGCLVSMLAVWNLPPQSCWFRGALQLAALASAILLAYTCCCAGHLSSELFQGGFTGIAIGAAVFILAMALAPLRPFTWLLESRPLVATGRLSYGLYLWHFPILVAISPDYSAVITDGNRLGLSPNVARLAVVTLTYMAALVSFHCVEKPFLRLMPSKACCRQ